LKTLVDIGKSGDIAEGRRKKEEGRRKIQLGEIGSAIEKALIVLTVAIIDAGGIYN
jgi:hypothetical protein